MVESHNDIGGWCKSISNTGYLWEEVGVTVRTGWGLGGRKGGGGEAWGAQKGNMALA